MFKYSKIGQVRSQNDRWPNILWNIQYSTEQLEFSNSTLSRHLMTNQQMVSCWVGTTSHIGAGISVNQGDFYCLIIVELLTECCFYFVN